MRIKLLLLTWAMSLMMSAVAQDSALQQQFESELKAKNQDVTSIKCSFTQTRQVAVLANSVDKDGVFYFTLPGNMSLSFHDGDYIKMTEKWFESRLAGKVNKTKVSSNPGLKNLSSILTACVVGDFEQLAKGFEVDVTQTAQEWVVTMTPKRGKGVSKITHIVLHFDINDLSLNVLKMQEKSGDYTMYKFANKEFNVAIDNSIFDLAK